MNLGSGPGELRINVHDLAMNQRVTNPKINTELYAHPHSRQSQLILPLAALAEILRNKKPRFPRGILSKQKRIDHSNACAEVYAYYEYFSPVKEPHNIFINNSPRLTING